MSSIPSIDGWPPEVGMTVEAGGLREKFVVRDPASGDLFVVKKAARAGPIEIATEVVATRIGECLGVPVPDVGIALRAGEVVLTSRAMLTRGVETLMHAKKLFIRRDPRLDRQLTNAAFRTTHTIENILDAIRVEYPRDAGLLVRDLVRLLAFDSLIGNSDRHWQNYGVVEPDERSITPPERPAEALITSARGPRLAPAFDNASCLFWSLPDEDLPRFEGMRAHRNKGRASICADGRKLRFAEVVRRAVAAVAGGRDVVNALVARYDQKRVNDELRSVIERAARGLLSDRRRAAMQEYLDIAVDDLRGTVAES